MLSQTIPAGGAVPATFLTTLNSFSTNIASPSAFNPANSNVVYTPPDSKWPYIQNWFVSVQRQLPKNTVIELSYNGNHSLRLPIIADYNQAYPNQPGQSLGVTARVPIPTFGPITWLYPAGDNHYNGLSARVEHRFTKGLYVLNSFTWGKAMGNSEQALETFAGYYQANPQNIRNLAAEKGPSSFDVKLNNVTSVVYQLPFGKGREFGANMNPVLDAFAGGWELNTINTAHTGMPLDVTYGATGRQHCQRAVQRLSRPAVPAPQCKRQRRQPEPLRHAEHLFRRVHVHHAACQRAVRECGPQFVPRSEFRAVGFFSR